MARNRIAGLLLCMAVFSGVWGQTTWTISSPGEKVKGTVQLADLGGQADYPTGQVRLYYSVSVGGPTAFSEVLQMSPMGLVRSDRNFVNGLTFVSEGAQRTIDSSYSMVMGKRSLCRNYCNEKKLTFKATGGELLEIFIRAYDDGFAYRYQFPDTSLTKVTMMSEASGFRIPAGSTMWMLPYNTPADGYSPAYEDCWQRGIPVGAATGISCKANDSTWCMPAMFRTAQGNWALIWETDVTRSYCNSRLSAAKQNVYRVTFPNAAEAAGIGAVTPSYTLPWTMPWRVIIAGTSPGTLLESTLSTDLATPSKQSDVSWIVPGRSSWGWWSDNLSGKNYATLKTFVDLAKQMGWEYSMVDANWDALTGGTWQQLVTYAASQKVGINLWYNSGGPTNAITGYTPRDRLYDSTMRINEFKTISSAGVKGVKVDFWLSDKQNIVKYYLDMFDDAAKYHLTVNPHGGTIPRGWQRTYPNCITAEAVRGAEMYIWDNTDPLRFTWQHTMMPFCRNAVASMDWTPVTFSDQTTATAHKTTYSHELALSVIFESGIQHFADRVSAYQTPAISVNAQTFLKQVPVAWDDTKYLQGYPGSWVVLARRKGNDWYVSGIAGDTAKNISVNLSFLQKSPASYSMTLLSDGSTVKTFKETMDTVGSTDSIALNIPQYGGWVARLVNLNPVAIHGTGVDARSVKSFQNFMTANDLIVLPSAFVGKHALISIYGLSGRLLKSAKVTRKTISLKKDLLLPPGVYMVHLNGIGN